MDTRDFTRVAVDIPAVVNHHGRIWKGRAEDLCLQGMFVACATLPPVGEEVEVTLRVPAGQGVQWLICRGTVVRVEKRGVGIEIREMSRESFGLLRDIVARISGDPARIDEELRLFICRLSHA